MKTYYYSNTMTERQCSYLQSLIQRNLNNLPSDLAGTHRVQVMQAVRKQGMSSGVSFDEASDAIDYLVTLQKSIKQTKPETQPGYYVKDDVVYLVKIGKDSGYPYAMKLDVVLKPNGKAARAKWVRAQGMARVFEHLSPLTGPEAARLGHQWGICVKCAATLITPSSVRRGFGPDCGEKLGWITHEERLADDREDRRIRKEEEARNKQRQEQEAQCSGGKCDGYSMCSKHSLEYQNRYGRAFNE